MLAVRLVRLIENHIEQLSRDLSEKVWSSPRCSDLNKVAVIKLLWLAICDIEDKRARQRAKERGLPASKRKAPGRLVEGQVTTNWKQALEQLALVYPDRINPHI